MKIGQSRKGSLLESIINILVGFTVAFLTQVVVFPVFGLEVSVSQNLAIGFIFTAVSLVRSYCLRRFFNWVALR